MIHKRLCFFQAPEALQEGAQKLLADGEKYDRRGSLGNRLESVFQQEFDGVEPAEQNRLRRVVGVAMEIEREILKTQTRKQKGRVKELGRLMDDQLKAFAGAAPERFYRVAKDRTDKESGLVADQQLAALAEVLEGTGQSKESSWFEAVGFKVLQGLDFLEGSRLPSAPMWIKRGIVKIVAQQIQKKVGGFVRIFPAAKSKDNPDGTTPADIIEALERDTERTGVGYQANRVVEAATCQREVDENIEWYKGAISAGARKIAIKPTALLQLSTSPVRTRDAIPKLAANLEEIFAHAAAEGSDCEISLDSEQAGLLDMTREAFLMAAKKYPQVRVKIAVQSYFPDSEERLFDHVLSESRERVAAGGQPMGIRLVCGANQVGETQFASANGWITKDGQPDVPIVDSRAMAHANYVRLIERLIEPLKRGEITLTIGSMNTITQVNVLSMLAEHGVFETEAGRNSVCCAMLKGMRGQEIFKVLNERYGVQGEEYVPVITEDVLVELFAYYLRRIDELTGADLERGLANYLGIVCRYGVDSPQFVKTQVKNGIIEAVRRHSAAAYPLDSAVKPRRGVHESTLLDEILVETLDQFAMTPHVNPGAPADLEWIHETIRFAFEEFGPTHAKEIPVPFEQDADDPDERKWVDVFGYSREGVRLGRVQYYTKRDFDKAYQMAKEDPSGWGEKTMTERRQIIANSLVEIRQARGDLNVMLMLEIQKAILEADGEINETLDGIMLAYLHSKGLESMGNVKVTTSGDGVATVICPKNFPVGIPAFHIIARLLAGYRVIVKPSGGEDEEAIMATKELVDCLHRAGVPEEALVFAPCDNETAKHMASNSEKIGFVGATATGENIMENNPEAEALMETGGRNVVIIDESADLKQAAKDVVQATCFFAGQKCSKPIAVICTKGVNMKLFRQHMMEIMAEMLIDTPEKPHVDVTPLSKPRHEYKDPKTDQMVPVEISDKTYSEDDYPNGVPLHVALSQPRKGEKWIHKPEQVGHPGIKEVVDWKQYQFDRISEIFGPIITIMQIDGDVPEAVAMNNNLPGSLTAAVYSHREEAITYALEHMRTGNLYINDKPTGALSHQGFGDGTGDSHLGAHGVKTGTPEFQIINSHFEPVSGRYAQYDKGRIKRDDPTGLLNLLDRLWAENRESFDGSVGSMADVNEGNRASVLAAAIHAGYSYMFEHSRYYSQKRFAPYKIVGQDDWIQSHSVGNVVLRIDEGGNDAELLAKIFAAVAAGNQLTVSVDPVHITRIEALSSLYGIDILSELNNVRVVTATEEQFVATLEENPPYPNPNRIQCVQYLNRDRVSRSVFEAAVAGRVYIDHRQSVGDGRIDMVTQYRQQSYSWVYHIAGDTSYEDMKRQQLKRNNGKRRRRPKKRQRRKNLKRQMEALSV